MEHSISQVMKQSVQNLLPLGWWRREILRRPSNTPTPSSSSLWDRGPTHFCSACCLSRNRRPEWHFLQGQRYKAICFSHAVPAREASEQTDSSKSTSWSLAQSLATEGMREGGVGLRKEGAKRVRSLFASSVSFRVKLIKNSNRRLVCKICHWGGRLGFYGLTNYQYCLMFNILSCAFFLNMFIVCYQFSW